MKRVIPPLLLFVSLPAAITAQPAPEYIGLLDREPVVETRQGSPFKLDAAPRELVEKLPVPPAPEDRVFAGTFRLFRKSPLDAQVVLVEPAQGKPFFYADFDFDGRFAASERAEIAEEPDGKWEAALLRFPSSAAGAVHFPVSVGRFTSREQAADEAVRRFVRSRVVYQQGWVQVEDRTVLVRYPLNLEDGKLQLTQGMLGMDLDGNGKIDRGLSRGESEVANEDGVVFRLGELYLSTRSVDPATGRIVLRTHPASDYRRFDLWPGATLPDFAFTDLEGRERRLSELRGKVVFLDFWGVWCGACVDEMPELRKLYETHRGRGFEILGMDFEDDLKTQKSFVAAMDLPLGACHGEERRGRHHPEFPRLGFPDAHPPGSGRPGGFSRRSGPAAAARRGFGEDDRGGPLPSRSGRTARWSSRDNRVVECGIMDKPRLRIERDPVIEAYKKDVDRTLLRENLKLTVEERLRNLMRLQRFAEEMRQAGRRALHGRS